tara:strand:- start:350 stop:679 length:330 start_codon:yes stop_codon:yes gene_type:complete
MDKKQFEIINTKLTTILDLLQKENKQTQNQTQNQTQPQYDKKIMLTNFKNCLLLHGNTYPYRSTIKQLSGKWNTKHKGWIVPKNQLSVVLQEIKEINYNGVENEKQLTI